jgi:hypothetical protein
MVTFTLISISLLPSLNTRWAIYYRERLVQTHSSGRTSRSFICAGHLSLQSLSRAGVGDILPSNLLLGFGLLFEYIQLCQSHTLQTLISRLLADCRRLNVLGLFRLIGSASTQLLVAQFNSKVVIVGLRCLSIVNARYLE